MLSLILAVVLAGASAESPPFYTAQEKWVCKFKSFSDDNTVTIHFGVFRSHVEDDVISDYSIVQNDNSALVFVMSNVGDTDIDGKTIKSTLVTMIDKRSRELKRIALDLRDAPVERLGTCQPY